MNLPDLPRVLRKKEASWTTTFLKNWVLEETTLPSGPIEVKNTNLDYISFDAVSPQQRADLLACTTPRGHWWKVADMGRKNDFDVVFYRNSPAYVIINFPKGFIVTTIGNYIQEMENSKRKSLTWDRAKAIAIIEKTR